jgi:hypothetical protein
MLYIVTYIVGRLIDTFVNCNRVTPGGSSTVQFYTQTMHKKTINLGRVRAVPRLYEVYPGICLTTEEKAGKNLSRGSRQEY